MTRRDERSDVAPGGTAAPGAPHPADPKQGAGDAKVPFAALPWAVITELAVAHGEGALKYGRHNWRSGDVLASTYYAAAFRHLIAWVEGEDTDPDSGLSHLVKAMSSLGVLRDAMIHGTMVDDRPPGLGAALMAEANDKVAEMRERVVGRKG